MVRARMIGAVIITHDGLADCLLKTAESISGKNENMLSMGVMSADTTDMVMEEISSAIRSVDAGDGVIIFTDMFGGTPTNIALSFFAAGKVEVLTGVNLPLLMKFISNRRTKPLADLAALLKDYGRSTITLAGEMLKEKRNSR